MERLICTAQALLWASGRGESYALVMAKSVADLLSKREGTRLDFKQDLSSMKRVLETVCSFLNTAGGTLVVGIEDQTRVVLGLDNVEK
jgi:predicted HTH transcriptional regulator